MTQMQEIELIELDEVVDDAVVCEPYSLECGEVAAYWHVYSCCGKKFPFCEPHSKQADAEAGTYDMCFLCFSMLAGSTYIKIPIGSW